MGKARVPQGIVLAMGGFRRVQKVSICRLILRESVFDLMVSRSWSPEAGRRGVSPWFTSRILMMVLCLSLVGDPSEGDSDQSTRFFRPLRTGYDLLPKLQNRSVGGIVESG